VVYTIIHSPLKSYHTSIQLLPECHMHRDMNNNSLVWPALTYCVRPLKRQLSPARESYHVHKRWLGRVQQESATVGSFSVSFIAPVASTVCKAPAITIRVNILAATCRTTRVSKPEPVTDVVW
jgi:hypothetical protein